MDNTREKGNHFEIELVFIKKLVNVFRHLERAASAHSYSSML